MEQIIRDLIETLKVLADRARTFDIEVADDTSAAGYKTAVRSRFKALLQALNGKITAIINEL
jgi:hypothetical protein